MVERLVPLFEDAGVRLVLSGHEHNFQHAVVDDIHYVVSGAAGKLRPEPPRHFDGRRNPRMGGGGPLPARARRRASAWSSGPIADVGDDGSLEPIEPVDPDGRSVEPVFEIPLSRAGSRP